MKIKTIMAISLIILISGCGGGGGSSPAPSSPSVPITTDTNTTIPVVTQTVWNTSEYRASGGLERVGAEGAYKEGYTGEGVIVAVLDTGIDRNNNYDLNRNLLEGRNFAGYTYDKNSGNFYYVNGGIKEDQISSIEYTGTGTYTTAPTVTISGDGTGAEAIVLLNPDGTIDDIYMTSVGSGYTNATVTINEAGTGGTGLTITNVRLGSDDELGHGSAVSGVIAGERHQEDGDIYDGSIHGVAFNAKLLPVKVIDKDGASVYSFNEGIKWANEQGAKVMNMSLGTTSAFGIDSTSIDLYKSVLANNATFVIASGNEGLDCLPVNGSINGRCSFPAALPWLSGNEDLLTQNGGWIVVGSVDENNQISTFSNKAGVTKNNYLVAPGESIKTTYKDGEMVYINGTSIATPFVSGAMALMYEKYPHLNGRDMQEIFFTTATDLGEVGVDDVYGNGLINIEKAFSPIGTLAIPTGNTVTSETKTVESTTLISSAIFGSKLLNLTSINNTIAVDDYQRDYRMNMTSMVYQTNDNFNFEDFTIVNYDGLLLGFNEADQKLMAGYKFGNKDIKISYSKDLLGSSGTGGLDTGRDQSLYMEFAHNLNISDNSLLKYKIDYGYGESKVEESTLIKNISGLHAMGGEVAIQYRRMGLFVNSPLAIVDGEMDLKIPESRNIDGTVNYVNYKESLNIEDREYRYGTYLEWSEKNLFSRINLNVIENMNNIYSEEKELEVNFNLNYIF